MTTDELPDGIGGGTTASPRVADPALLRGWPLPAPSGTKYARGQVLVVGGDRSTPGAVMLAGVAALRVGAGRLSLGVASSVAPHVAVAVPECGAIGLDEDDAGTVTGHDAAEALAHDLDRSDAVLIGPGLGSPAGARELVRAVVEALPEETPVVLDAFGATVLPQLPDGVQAKLRGRLVLTPNSGELAFMLDRDDLPDDEVLAGTSELAATYDAAVGCNEWVVADGQVWRMSTGDTGLGTSGSGDVMAGAVAGLLSRGATRAQALVWGKHLHAAAGDALTSSHGRVGFLAGEICEQLPRALTALRGD